MIITSDLHTHTTFSHGTGTVEENVVAAIEKGLKKIAVTDHGVGHLAYGIRDVDKYLNEIERCKREYTDKIEVLSGVELNLISLDGELDLPKGYENSFDLLLFGYHKFVGVKGINTFFHFYLPKAKGDRAVYRATNAYINAINGYAIDIVTHPGYGLPIDKEALAYAAQKRGTALEINAKHPEFTSEELKSCLKSGVMFSVNSDAHCPQNIGGIKNAMERVYAAGVPASSILGAKEESK